jgi:uncharacterized protein YbgA (DUF1722 family)
MRTNRVSESVCRQIARARGRKSWIHGRRIATVTLGAALSIGGVSEAFQSVHFIVRKDLDSIRVVRQDGLRKEVVARLGDGFTANSLFKISGVFPQRLVSRELRLFDKGWVADRAGEGLFRTELTIINDHIRGDFFANAVPFGGLIHAKSTKYDVDPALVAAVMETESRFRSNARSQVGAQGLMQLMPRTGRWMGARNLYDPEQNVDAGTRYLSYLSRRFDGDLKNTIAAYNAGEGVVQRYGGVPPYRETRSYVARVMSRYLKHQANLREFTATVMAEPPATSEALVR